MPLEDVAMTLTGRGTRVRILAVRFGGRDHQRRMRLGMLRCD
jgi:hypothetical protein